MELRSDLPKLFVQILETFQQELEPIESAPFRARSLTVEDEHGEEAAVGGSGGGGPGHRLVQSGVVVQPQSVPEPQHVQGHHDGDQKKKNKKR